LPKVGRFTDEVLPYRGDLYLADISVPPVLYSAPRLDLEVPAIFSKWDVLQIS